MVMTFRFLGVIRGRAQREPGIQWYLRGAGLDPGPALCAVRDDIKRRSGPSGMAVKIKERGGGMFCF